MTDPNAVLAALPAPIQAALGWGLGAGALLTAIWRLVPAKQKPADASTPSDASRIALAMTAPLSDANYLLKIVDSLNRLGDFAEQGLKTLDEIRDEAERTTKAAARAEEAAGRVENAIVRFAQTMSGSKL